MTRRSFSTDVALLTAVRMGSVLGAFLTSVLAARLLGPAALGAGAVAITVATISALLANSGMGISSIYFLGRRPEQRLLIVQNIATVAAFGSVVAIVLVLVAIPLAGNVVLPGHPPAVLLAAAVLAPAIVASDIGGAMVLGLHDRSRYMLIEGVRTVGAFATTALVLLFVLRSEVGYVLGAAMAMALAGAVALVGVSRIAGPLRPRLDGGFVREALSMGVRGQAGNILQFLNLRLDILIVSALLNVEAVGIYLVAVRASESVVQVANAVSSFIFPHVAAQAEHDDTAATERAIRVTLGIVAVSAVALALLAGTVLSLAFGPRFTSGTTTLQLSLIAMVPLALARILSGDLKGRGRADYVSLANLLAVALTAIGCLILIPPFGIEGAAVASVATYVGLAAALLVAYHRVTGARLRSLVPRLADVGLVWEIGRRALR